MKILVLGANGQLGSDILRVHRELKLQGQCIPFCRKDLDVSVLDDIRSCLLRQSFDVLINCTSYHKLEWVKQNPALAMAINAYAVQRLAQVCHERKARFVHISSDYVFDGFGREPLKETDSPRPLNVYGASKLMGEGLSMAAHDDCLILRVAALFGISGSSGKGGNFVENMLHLAKEKGQLQIVSDQWMSPTATKQVARMIFGLLNAEAPAGVYHAVNSGRASWYEFAKAFIEQVGIRCVVQPVAMAERPASVVRPQYTVLSNKKLSAIVGSIPSWQLALKEYLSDRVR